VIVTGKLRSYAAAQRIVMPGIAHRQHRYLNNRAENSHQPTREREKRMRRFKSARHAQRLSRCMESLPRIFRPRRHLLSAADYHRLRTKRFRIWNEVTARLPSREGLMRAARGEKPPRHSSPGTFTP
jgi:putative transposase